MAKLAPWVSRLLIIIIGYLAAIIALRFVPLQNTAAAALAPAGNSASAVSEVAAASIPSVSEIANDAAAQNFSASPELNL